MRIIRVIFIFSGLLAISNVFGQQKISPRVLNLFLKAENYRNHFAYSKAIDNYQRFLTYKNDSQEAMVSMADCYFKIKAYDQALLWYDSALKYGKLRPPHGFQYTNLLLTKGMNVKAKSWLVDYVKDQPNDREAVEKLNGLENMNTFFKDSSLYTVTNLSINSSYPEFAPVLYKDGFVFVSGRGKKTEPYLDLFYCNWKNTDSIRVVPFSPKINSNLHEGPSTIYDHDRKIIFTRNNKIKNRGLNNINIVYFQLFSAEKDQQGEWSEPKLLSLNNKQYSIGHPTISQDGRTLYFSSTIPGGFGGSDIYKSLLEDNAWTKPENLGAGVNTAGNEMFPYLFQDSILYFASDGYRGLGGLDIYKTYLLHPTIVYNMGYPINTIKDDFSITFYPEGDKGFFSSNRDGGRGGDDLYAFTIKQESTPTPESSEKIEVDSIPTLAVYYTIQILALKNSKLVPKIFLKDLKGVVKHDGRDGLHRYTYGEYKGAEDALEMLNSIKALGYEDAFIRKVEKYAEISKAPGENTDLLYEKMRRVK